MTRLLLAAAALALVLGAAGNAKAQQPTVSILGGSADEGSDLVFTVGLNQMVENSAVQLTFTITHGTTDSNDLGGAVTISRDTRQQPVTLSSDRVDVTIPAGQTAVTIAIPINDDGETEGAETFTATLSHRGNSANIVRFARGGNTTAATGTIRASDGGGAPSVSVSIANESADEDAAAGNMVFTVNLSRAVNSSVRLDVAVTPGSTNPVTLADDLGTLPPTVVTIAANTTSATITVPIINDEDVEGDETFTVTISENRTVSLPSGVTITRSAATGTIRDDDDDPAPADAMVSIRDMTVAEDVGDAVFTVSLTEAVDSDVLLSVDITPGSTNPVMLAGSEADLGTVPSRMVTIDQGETSATITVPIIDDNEAEEDETFTVTISERSTSPLPSGVTITRSAATGTITDNDGETPPVVSAMVSIADAASVAENGGDAVFTVSLTEAVDSAVTLDVAYAAGSTNPVTLADDLGALPPTVTIAASATRATITVPITNDDEVEEDETFTVTISERSASPLPDGVTIADGTATGTITNDDEAVVEPPPVVDRPDGSPSVLIGPRRIGAGAALRRHAGRFDSMTGMVARHRLDGRGMGRLSGSETLGSGAAAAGGALGGTGWGAWIDGAWADIGGAASGRQADVHGGVDYLDDAAGWLVGALIGYEQADLDIGDATFESDYAHFGVYGAARLSERLRLDGAATYGTATPDVAYGDATASYDANRFTARGALTGDFGFGHGPEDGASVRVEPQLGLLYSRETLEAFTDSDDGVAGRETLELGRFSVGPRLTWGFDGGQVIGGARVQWDFLELEDEAGGRVSGAANVGVRLDVAPGVSLDVQGDVDGIGMTDEFRSVGGRIDLGVRF